MSVSIHAQIYFSAHRLIFTIGSSAATTHSVIGKYEAKGAYGYMTYAGICGQFVNLFEGMKNRGAIGLLCSATVPSFLRAVGEEKCYD
jgi:hypothetical protein